MIDIIKIYSDGSTSRCQTFETLAEAREFLTRHKAMMAENGKVIAEHEDGFTVETSSGVFAYEVKA